MLFRIAGEGFDKKADELFYRTMQEIKSVVLEAADVRTTAFYSHASSSNKHGQHELAAITNTKPNLESNTAITGQQQQQPPGFEMDDIYSSHEVVPSGSSDQRANDDRLVLDNDRSITAPTSGDDVLLGAYHVQDRRVFPGDQFATDLPQYPLWRARHAADYDADTIRANQFLELVNNFATGGSMGHPNDRHHEPLQPSVYLRFRVDAAIAFYRQKIPKYNYIRSVSQTIVILGSIGSGIVAFFNVSTWSVLISSIAAAVAAFMQFHGTNKKINRYSATVHALTDMKCWWDSLPSIDRSVVSNIDSLILSCENIIRKECESWKSTTSANRKVVASDNDGNNNSEDTV